MSTREDLILWLDLETTGSSPDSDILEVGALMTLADGRPISTFRQAIYPRDLSKLLKMDPVVVDMHMKSGLVAELMTGWAHRVDEVRFEILRWLETFSLAKDELVPLAGSGVSHFDRQFIRRDWPEFDKRLTYWAYDVGVIRRALRLAGKEQPSPSDTLNHRALDDARDHAREFFRYLEMLKTL